MVILLIVIVLSSTILFLLSWFDGTESCIFQLSDNVSKKIRLFKACVTFVLVFTSGLFIGHLITWEILVNDVNNQLGFGYATPEEEEGEIFIITEVIPGKAMDEASMMENDRICFEDVNTLYHLLVFNQGKEVEIPIKRNNLNLSIYIQVPFLKLHVNPERIL